MYCTKCGKELSEEMEFCPQCGCNLKADSTASAQPVKKTDKKKTLRNILIAAFVAIIAIVFVINKARQAELLAVKTVAESALETVRTGLPEEDMNTIVDSIIYQTVGNNSVGDYLVSNINGSDVQDIYGAIMRYMYYEVENVEKVGSSHYKVTVYVQNIDNLLVAENALEAFYQRYAGKSLLGKAIQFYRDYNSDKSETIARIYSQVADAVYATENSQYFIYNEFVIDVQKVDGEWVPTIEEGLDNFIFTCIGF